MEEKLARNTVVRHLKLEYKMQFFPMEDRLMLTSGVAATNKRWCCLHNLNLSKELETQVLKLTIGAFF